MFDSSLVDFLLLRGFRLRTRGFLRMEDDPGTVPPAPRSGASYLYIHIPFCEALCPFCSFHRIRHNHDLAARYFQSLRREIRLYHDAGFRFAGAYFGGGTPTTEPGELVETIGLVRELFGVTRISVETNPRDLSPSILEPLRRAGVTRLSVGVQSFDDGLLEEMERREKYGGSAEIQERIRASCGLFETLNLDLIFNLPHQTSSALERDLEIVNRLGANQVSLYPLMASPSMERRMAASMGLPDRRRVRASYETILARLRPAFTPSSAWCFNRGGSGTDEYVVDADHYVGVGSGAFSYLEGTLYATSFSLQAYEHRIAQGLTGITERRRLSDADRMRYDLLLRLFALRLDSDWAVNRYGRRFFRNAWSELRTLEFLGAVRRDERGWRTTERGMYWMMLLMTAFYESVNGYRDAMRAHIRDELQQYDTLCVPSGNQILRANGQ